MSYISLKPWLKQKIQFLIWKFQGPFLLHQYITPDSGVHRRSIVPWHMTCRPTGSKPRCPSVRSCSRRRPPRGPVVQGTSLGSCWSFGRKDFHSEPISRRRSACMPQSIADWTPRQGCCYIWSGHDVHNRPPDPFQKIIFSWSTGRGQMTILVGHSALGLGRIEVLLQLNEVVAVAVAITWVGIVPLTRISCWRHSWRISSSRPSILAELGRGFRGQSKEDCDTENCYFLHGRYWMMQD